MLTTKEAAERLSVSRSRVLELIKNGQLSARKLSGVWLVDEDSVEERMRNVNKKGGRPKAGAGKNEVRFTLMNRTHEVADLVYDEKKLEFTHIGDASDALRAPIGLADASGTIALADFNAWWSNRGIPRTRSGLDSLLREAGTCVPEELLYRNLGLSLSDQYWIRPCGSGLAWKDVNFFGNDFEQVDAATAGFAGAASALRAHPDNTSDGNLEKRWVIRDGVRMLRKAGLRNSQEPFNEVVATALFRRLLAEGEYVRYSLDEEDPGPACLCENFLSDEEEYVPALYVMRALPQSGSTPDFDHYLACCEALGAGGARGELERMIVCDDIMANTDRHFRNFGIVRNVETLECGPAPIFDTGTSLWCDVELAALERGETSFESKQFETSPARQMLLVEDMSWFDPDALEGFIDEAIEILSGDDAIANRIPYVRTALQHRVSRMISIAEWS